MGQTTCPDQTQEEVLNVTYLWHGTHEKDPHMICSSNDGVDFRRVRGEFRSVALQRHSVPLLTLYRQARDRYQPAQRRDWDGVNLYRKVAPNFYGRGSYFSDNAAYCDDSFAYDVPDPARRGQRQLILARVMVGKVCDFGEKTQEDLKVPPVGYDSVRGGPHRAVTHDCRMTVVYTQEQVYPQYIVTYDPCGTVTQDTGVGAGAGGAGAGAGGAGAGARSYVAVTPPLSRPARASSSVDINLCSVHGTSHGASHITRASGPSWVWETCCLPEAPCVVGQAALVCVSHQATGGTRRMGRSTAATPVPHLPPLNEDSLAVAFTPKLLL